MKLVRYRSQVDSLFIRLLITFGPLFHYFLFFSLQGKTLCSFFLYNNLVFKISFSLSHFLWVSQFSKNLSTNIKIEFEVIRFLCVAIPKVFDESIWVKLFSSFWGSSRLYFTRDTNQLLLLQATVESGTTAGSEQSLNRVIKLSVLPSKWTHCFLAFLLPACLSTCLPWNQPLLQ